MSARPAAPQLRLLFAILVASLFGLFVRPAAAVESVPRQLEGIVLTQKMGSKVDLDLTFTDQDGRSVRLGDLVDGERPVLLTMNYYRCHTLCGVQLNALLAGLKGLDWSPGDGTFRVVTLSFDSREGFELARDKRASFVDALGRGDVDWTFLVGAEDQIASLADAVGMAYRWDEDTQQWAHPAALIFLSPDGTVTRYLAGIQYPPRDIKFALMEAAAGRLGSPVDKLVLSCFGYDESSGRYTATAFGVMRLGGVATMFTLGLFGIVMWRREKTRRPGSPS